MKTTLIVAIVTAAGLAASSAGAQQAAPKPQRQCFYSNNVSSFAPQGDEVVNLRVGVKDYYRLDMFGPCQDVDWNNSIALVSRGSSFICAGIDATIISRTSLGPRRCPVKSIRKLTPVEVAALPKGAKP